MNEKQKNLIIAGFFTIIAAILAAIMPAIISYFIPNSVSPIGHPNLEITEFRYGDCGTDNNYTCIFFQVKNTGNEIAIINGVDIKKLNQSIISDSIKTSYPRLTKNDLPADMYMVRLRTDYDINRMNDIGMCRGVSMYYPMPPQSSQQFSILLDSDRTANYEIQCIVRSDIGDLKPKHIENLRLKNVNTSLSDAYQVTINTNGIGVDHGMIGDLKYDPSAVTN